jgi:DNA-binding NtrC family response regulator
MQNAAVKLGVGMDAQPEFVIRVTHKKSAADVERELIERMLEFMQGNKFQTAVRLGLHPSTLERKLKEYRKLGRLVFSNPHPTGAGEDASDPLPLGGQQKSK